MKVENLLRDENYDSPDSHYVQGEGNGGVVPAFKKLFYIDLMRMQTRIGFRSHEYLFTHTFMSAVEY